MTDINQLTAQDTLSASDLLPIWSGENGDTRRVSLGTLLTWLVSQLGSAAGMITQYAAPGATGFSVSLAPPVNGTSVFLLLTPLAVYAAGTIVLPAQSTCIDGQEVLCTTTQAVTALTVGGNGAVAVNGAPTTLTANGSFRLRYDGISRSWFSVT